MPGYGPETNPATSTGGVAVIGGRPVPRAAVPQGPGFQGPGFEERAMTATDSPAARPPR
ncbi:hypothetical protein ABZ614_42060 [Streptomyces sp. NPDC013178]|uniref:hypothetical protein n=1 Tax=unclassified Streptomyces TaxID=2593676 RepID=UPI0033C374F9